jgi:hypothetical protein
LIKTDTSFEGKMNQNENRNSVQAEALASLAEIERVIDSSHVIEFPYQILFAYGAFIVSIPAIERATTYLTFGDPVALGNQWTLALRHVLFYGAVFAILKFLVLRYTDAWKGLVPAHPLIRSAAEIQKIVLATGAVAMIVLGRADRMDLWLPILFPLTGVLFRVFGTFARGPLKKTAWFQVALGLAYGLALKEIPSDRLWVPGVELYGASFLVCGAVLYRKRRAA